MTLFKALMLTAIFIIALIGSFIIARGLLIEQARGGTEKIGSVSTMPVLRGAME